MSQYDVRPLRKVFHQEVREYLQETSNAAYYIALGVFLCIISVTPPVMLDGIATYLPVTEAQRDGIGGILMFLLLGIAMSTFVINGFRLKKYEWLRTEGFTLEYGTLQELKREKEYYQPKYAILIIFGSLICLASVIPAVLLRCMDQTDVLVEAIYTSSIFLCIGLGIFFLIIGGITHHSYYLLLHEEGRRKVSKDTENMVLDIISTIYWCTVTMAYLVWSFISFEWNITWMIWPLAGILFGLLCRMLHKIYDRRGSV